MNPFLKSLIVGLVVGVLTYGASAFIGGCAGEACQQVFYSLKIAAWTSAIVSFIVVLLFEVLGKYKLSKK